MDDLPKGERLDIDRIEPDPNRVLIEYDGPRFFGANIECIGTDVLVFSCDEDETLLRCIVVPTTDQIVEGLNNGSITIRDSLTRTTARPWLVDLDSTSWSVHAAVSPHPDRFPERYLPKSHLMLRAELQPLLTLRMEGPKLLRWSTPRDAVLHAFKNVPEALKRLLDYALEQGAPTGRPKEPIRALYGLPAQRFAFSSFEVSYRRPVHDTGLFGNAAEEEAIADLAALLNKAIQVAMGEQVHANEDERRVLLEAAYKLAPPARGIVHAVSFSGAMVQPSAGKLVLRRGTRSRIKHWLNEIEQPEEAPPFFAVEGHVGDIDFDEMKVELRAVQGLEGTEKMVAHVEPDLLDEVSQLGVEGGRVRAFGERTVRGVFHLTGIFKIASPTEDST